jgi:hypothetical protein
MKKPNPTLIKDNASVEFIKRGTLHLTSKFCKEGWREGVYWKNQVPHGLK